MFTDQQIARVYYVALRMLQRNNKLFVDPPWPELDDEVQESIINDVTHARGSKTPLEEMNGADRLFHGIVRLLSEG